METALKKVWRPVRAATDSADAQPLEPELRTEADAHVVVYAAVEEDVISNFGSHADRSRESFNSATRVHGKVGRATAQADCGRKPGRSALISHREVFKSNFSGQEHAKGTGAGLEL